MPSKRKRARGDRRSGFAAGIVVVVIVAVIAYLALKPSPQITPRVTVCVAGPGGDGLQLTTSQAAIAATIAGVASKRHMPDRAVAIAYATALQESKLSNLDYGDRDSVGVFQQRPSEGWGTTKQIEDPVYATSRFFEALAAVPNYLQHADLHGGSGRPAQRRWLRLRAVRGYGSGNGDGVHRIGAARGVVHAMGPRQARPGWRRRATR